MQNSRKNGDGGPSRNVLVIGLPWFRSGTGQVMQSQVTYFAMSGWRTMFVCVPRYPRDFSTQARVEAFQAQACELGADHTYLVDFESGIGAWSRWAVKQIFVAISRVLGWTQTGKNLPASGNAMEEAMLSAQQSYLPASLRSHLEDKNVDLIVVNHVYAMPFAKRLMDFLANVKQEPPLIVVTHDVQTMILADNGLIPGVSEEYSVEGLPELQTELEALSASDALLHVGQFDARFFGQKLPAIPQVTAYPYIEPCKSAPKTNEAAGGTDFIFVGANHVANLEALAWFFEQVWPEFDDSPPRIKIVGNVAAGFKVHHPQLYKAHKEHFTGEVEDLTWHYAEAAAVLAPMMSGRGISIKTIEAAAAGKPLIATPHAFRGIPDEVVRNSRIEIAQNAREFADMMRRALHDPVSMSVASSKLYRALFTYDRFAASMDAVVEAAGVNLVLDTVQPMQR